MDRYKWIFEKGRCNPNELIDIAIKYCSDNTKYLALYIEKPEIGIATTDAIREIKLDNLMELRIFSLDKEFMATRSMYGENFGWRVTSDKGLSKEEDFIVRDQLIDVNKVKSIINSDDIKIFDKAKIVSYLVYDEFGIAKVADNRICGFVE